MKHRICLMLLTGILSLISLIPVQAEGQIQTHITSLVWNSTGTLIAATFSTPENEPCDGDRDLYAIRLFNADLTPYKNLRAHLCSVNSAAFNQDGTELISTDHSGKKLLWDINSGEIISRDIGFISWDKVIWHPSSTDFAVMDYEAVGFYISLFEGKTGLLASDVGFTGNFTDIDWSPDGQWIAVSNDDSTVGIWDVSETNKIIRVFQGHNSPVQSVAWNPVSDSDIIASADETGVINVWDAENGGIIASAVTPQTIRDLVWSPDGQMLASTGDDGLVHLWTVSEAALTEVKTLGYHAPVYALAWSPDRATLAYGGEGIDGQNGQVQLAGVSDLIAPPDRPCSPRHY